LRHRELCFVPRCKSAVGLVQLAHLWVRKRAEDTGLEWARNPSRVLDFRLHALSYFDGTDGFATNHNLFDFAESGVAYSAAQILFNTAEPIALLTEQRGVAAQGRGIGSREPTRYLLSRQLELILALDVTVKDAQAERLQHLIDLLAEYAQGFRRVRSHQHRLPLSQQVAQQVSDRVRLSVPGGPCTSTAFDLASRAAISYCSALAALLNKMSGPNPSGT